MESQVNERLGHLGACTVGFRDDFSSPTLGGVPSATTCFLLPKGPQVLKPNTAHSTARFTQNISSPWLRHEGLYDRRICCQNIGGQRSNNFVHPRTF